MDQMQKSLCDMIKQRPVCLMDRSVLRAALSDYLPNNKLQQNLLLNAFDNDVVQNLRKGSDITLSALNCISQLENDYGTTKDAAFWSVQTWRYLLGLDTVADALVVLQPQNQAIPPKPNANVPIGKEYKIGLGVYRAGTDFPAGEVSVQVTTKARLDIHYGIGKNPNRINTNQYFMDKMYVRVEEGNYLKLESFETGVAHQFVVKSLE